MLNIAYDHAYVLPLPDGHRFPMLKYELIATQLVYEGTANELNFFQPRPIDEETILYTHSADYWYRLKQLALTDREVRRTGFPLSQQLVEREMLIAGGTVRGAELALSHKIAFNIAGGTHHAGSNWGEGFCLLNDQAIAANYLLKRDLANRILIIDLDVHQGNGTAEIFSGNDRVFTFSVHAEKNFPFRKEKSDCDIGLDNRTGDQQYLDILNKTLPAVFDRFRPDFVFYLSGVDVLKTDKLGHLSLSREGCKQRDKAVLELCSQNEVPLQVSMGGGYSSKISDIVEAHCNTFRLASYLYF